MKIMTVALFLLFCLTLSARAAEPPSIKVLQDRGSSITIEFRLNGYDIMPLNIEGIPCSRVVLPHEVTFLEKGFPALPTIVRNIIIPDDGLMDYRILDVEYEVKKVDRIVPSKGNLYRNVDPNTVPYTFDKFYETDAWWPEKIVEIEGPFILRDYRGISVRLNPFQYNPARNELKAVKKVAVEVFENGKGGANIFMKRRGAINQEFLGIYENMFLNFTEERYDSISERPGRMLIITADAYNANMQTFIKWKKKKGINTKIVNISTIGNTQTAIKNRIQAEDDSTDLVWVLLVGDSSEVYPARGNRGAATGMSADPVYTYTRGSDFYSDLFISRMSSRNGVATNIDKQVSRSIGYEKTPQMAAAWYHIGLGIASNQTGGTPYADSTRCNFLRDSLLTPRYYYTAVNKSYDSWGTATMIKNFIEQGTSVINYIGHGSVTGWSNGGGFSITNINSLNNPWKLPFVLSVACVVGQFSSDCYCEASVTAGEVNQPDGFLVHWGSSINQSWEPPCWGQEGAVNLLTHDRKNTFGGICFNGASYMIEHYGPTSNTGIEMAQTWHIFGDGSVQLRTNTPDSMIVTHSSIVNPGLRGTFTVNVKDNDGSTPIPGALVCCWIYTQTPEVYATGYTNSSGSVTLTVSPQHQGDSMWVTVTKYNYKPYEGYALVGPIGVEDNLFGVGLIKFDVSATVFKRTLEIAYSIGRNAKNVELMIYDASGRLVRQWDNETIRQSDKIIWSGDDDSWRKVPAGVYFIRFNVGDYKRVEKVVLLR